MGTSNEKKEIDRLADFLIKYYADEIGGGKRGGESAVDVAIRLLSIREVNTSKEIAFNPSLNQKSKGEVDE